ncbi:zinc-binding dehydrogenase [Streptomyces sp. NPDC037389]|uniref:quinone oxidoreductase family protein n=1 Tax=Streptomyces sp. NPDC037389 TaxID=3155369 RepID=UPI0033F577BA
MRALIQTGVGDVGVLKLTDTPAPTARGGQLLVRTTAIGLNFHDVEDRRRIATGLTFPVVPGTDVVGVVEDVGPGAEGFAVGDRVVALVRSGGFAEYAVIRAQMAARLPDGLDDATAASIPTAGLTAWFLARDHVPDGTGPVVAHAAAGGVGHWLGALLPPRAPHTIGIVSSPRKAELARQAGYRHVIDRSAIDRSAGNDLVRAVRRATGGYGASVVLDPVAGPRFADSFRMLHPGGHVVLYGRAAGNPELTGLPTAFLDARRNLGLHTWYLGRAVTLHARSVGPALAELAGVLADGRVRMPVTELPLSEVRHGHTLLESGATVGKVVFRP